MESRRKRSRSQILKWCCYVLGLFVCAALQTTPGLFQLGQAAQNGTFPRPRRADHRDHFALLQGKRNPLEHLCFTKALF